MFKKFQVGSFKVFSDSDVKKVHEATVELLEKVGIKMHNQTARQIFKEKGAVVDDESRIVKIPRAMLEDAIDSTPSKLVLYGREEKNDLVLIGGVGISL